MTLGGLAGSNSAGSLISSSFATGNVTDNTALTANIGKDCSSGNCDYIEAGGLVGQNSGTIRGGAVPLSPLTLCGAGTGFTCGGGTISVGSGANGGGLVSWNDGIIDTAYATGVVTGAAGLSGFGNNGNATNLGGLAASNQGHIVNSYATGAVGATGAANLQLGGLVSENSGTIDNSFAKGDVSAGNNSNAGGLVSDNSHWNNSGCVGCPNPDGFTLYSNTATINNSHAEGSVTVGATSLAGGLAGSSDGRFDATAATGAVLGGANSILGGLIGAVDITAVITNSSASGSVGSTGANSWVGGFVGVNGGTISGAAYTGSTSLSNASGPVNGTSASLLGGFAGVNFGLITNSTTAATSTVTASGTNNFVGGFSGVNFGFIDPSTSAGAVTVGANNTVGGFTGANGTLTGYTGVPIPGTFPAGTIQNSSGTGYVNGTPPTPGTQVGTTNPTSLPAIPAVAASCDSGFGLCAILQFGFTFGPTAPVDPLVIAQIDQLKWSINNDQTNPLPTSADLTTPPADTPPPGTAAGSGPGKSGFTPPPLPPRSVPGPNGETRSSVPPPGETRYFNNQVLLQLNLDIPDGQIPLIAQQLGLKIITSETLTALGRRMVRFELPPGMSVRDAILRLEANRLVSVAAPVYHFALSQTATDAAEAESAQYMLGKMHLNKAHAMASGKGVIVAMIDLEVDKRHTELQGTIAKELDTLDLKEPPHAHGTAMAGAIVSRDRLKGVSPGANILFVRAFSQSSNTAEGTTISIVRGIEWALSQGARVINMSFAGPRDPVLERALKAAHDKGIVLVAAAGNAGPKSPPLYPGADPNVIAVTATDDQNRLFRGANQGPQVSVAAPGVDILAPAPGETYQVSTGTSIAAAHVSGVVALMLELNPKLKSGRCAKNPGVDGDRSRSEGQGQSIRLGPGRCAEGVGGDRRTQQDRRCIADQPLGIDRRAKSQQR